MKLSSTPTSLTTFAILGCLIPTAANGIIIQVDTSFDTGNPGITDKYFSPGSAERARLDDAVAFFQDLIIDNLDAIAPTGDYNLFESDSWSAEFTNPSTGGTAFVDNLVVPADTIILYVGARGMSGSQIGDGGFGSYDLIATTGSPFRTAVETRGESGVGSTDFAPWGGYLAVDNGITWDTTLAGGGSNQHLYSTLLHEIGHVLGIGTADSWFAQVTSNYFTGTESTAEHGSNPLLWFDSGTSTYAHWRNNSINSNIYGTSTLQEVAMDPSIDPGVVKLFTNLDVAALDDIGWDIAPIPEPSQSLLLGLAALALLSRRRR